MEVFFSIQYQYTFVELIRSCRQIQIALFYNGDKFNRHSNEGEYKTVIQEIISVF